MNQKTSTQPQYLWCVIDLNVLYLPCDELCSLVVSSFDGHINVVVVVILGNVIDFKV